MRSVPGAVAAGKTHNDLDLVVARDPVATAPGPDSIACVAKSGHYGSSALDPI